MTRDKKKKLKQHRRSKSTIILSYIRTHMFFADDAIFYGESVNFHELVEFFVVFVLIL